MAVIYLAVNSTWAASGVTDQGSLDSTTGTPVGSIVIPCPGVFPCRISCKSSVGNGTTTAVVAQVYAGASHVVVQEYLHDYLPAVGNRLRIESIQLGTKVAGGLYIQPLQTTATPSPAPYANILGAGATKLPSISLNGLPANLFRYLTAPVVQVTNTYYSNVGQFDTIFDRHYLDDGVNLLWSSQTTGAAPISISLGSNIASDNGHYLTASATSLLPKEPIKFLIAPRPPSGLGIIDADATYGSGHYPGSRRSVHTFPVTEGAPTFACFSGAVATYGGVAHLPTVYGTSSSNYIKSLAVYPVSSMLGVGTHMYSFAGINAATDQVFMGSFPIANTTTVAADMYFQSLEMYRTGDDCAALKPAFAFTTEYSSVSTPFTNNYWSSSYPLGTRFNKYSDVKTNQYGYVFLNKNTKHLEFLFAPHMDPWSTEASTQVIHKLVHAPPRSADYIPALNMQFGVSPLTPSGDSIYKVNDATIRGFYDSDHHIHGGGGHVMALGTYNGAIVHQGRVTVWGSNRWGQCVIPAVLNSLPSNITLVDVAVANAPPVLLSYLGTYPITTEYYTYAKFSVYSEDVAEQAARNYDTQDSLDATTGANPFTFSYPHSKDERYGRHINYTNLPGHVVVVTSTGWVYAWGNNKYYQCAVPEEISLVDINGALKPGDPTDPISEVAAGAFHTVARSKAGVLYVWGAGAPYVATLPNGTANGYITTSTASDSIPSATTTNTNVSRSVHFGQSCLATAEDTATSASGLAIPSSTPAGLASATTITEVYQFANFTLYSATSITLLTKGGVNVGQKTATGFCPADPAGGRLKGMIAAGAFHTAVIDNQLKIQCFGAGRGPVAATAVGITVDVTNSAAPRSLTSAPQWGSSYSAPGTSTITGHLFSTYPHYCQSIGQYRAPYHNTSYNTETTAANLFRHSTTVTDISKLKFFQDLLFKKVTCGPFTTHGIVHSVSRVNTTDAFTTVDKAHLEGRAVSWGCTHGPRSKFLLGTGPTGVLGVTGGFNNLTIGNYSECGYSRTDVFSVASGIRSSLNTNSNTAYSAAGTLCGAGAIDTESTHTINSTTSSTPRMFEVLNRVVNTGSYANHLSLVSNPGSASGNTALGTVSAGVGAGTANACACPVTISRFKVKDLASCGDYTMFIGYVNNLSQSSTKQWPGDGTDGQYGSFDYEASVFFTGEDNYCVIPDIPINATVNDLAVSPRPNLQDITGNSYGRHYANNPYAGTNLTRRNKIGNETSGVESYHYGLNTAIPLKTRSLHFGLIKPTSTGVTGALLGDGSASRAVKYVIPTTALASANMVAAVVNMDNRPVAWTGFFQQATHNAPLDLSLLPSVPISSFKLGKGHIMAVTAGDWPVAIGLSTLAGTPRLVSELGNRLFATAVTGTTTGVADTLISGEVGVYTRPVLLAWGAGDGREQGTSLLAFPRDRTSRSTYGMGFLDTHAIARHDISGGNTLAVTTDAWENYYGHYRWNVHSSLSPDYLTFNDIGLSPEGGTGGGAAALAGKVIRLPAGHHAIEAMQSILSFRPDKYPTTFDAVALAGRGLLNGSNVAAIPAAAYRPFVDYSTPKTGTDLKRTVCCATAADEAESNYASINSMQEYHSPLGYYQQSYTDYAVEYAAGSMHSAVLFKSACLSYPNIAAGGHLTDLSSFTSMFMADASGIVPFGNRRVCKLGIVGYGCENQTAGRERKLSDGMAPLVPMLFGTNAKVYCGDSYTLVTEPIKVLTLSSATVDVSDLGAPAGGGSGFTEKIIPITVSPTLFSRRIRGLDVVLTFTATSAATAIPLHNLNIKVKYKSNTWMVLGKVKANLDTTPANAFVPNGTATTVYRFSDRFNPTNSYKYADYDEVGLNPSTSGSYTLATNYFLKGAATAPTIPALSKQGCYYPVTVVSDVATAESWSMVGTTGGVVLPFNEPTIDVVIEDYSETTQYAGYTIEVTLEVEVDAADLPYVLFGPTRSGVFNEIAGLGPSIQADINSFNPATNLPIASCPCEQDLGMDHRKAPKSFLPDSSFVCGTKKYGPSGNRDNYAAYVLEGFVDTTGSTYSRSPLLSGARVTANFFHVFDTIPHRSLLRMSEQLYATGPVLHALPAAAFVSTGTIISLGPADVKVVNLKAEAAAVRLVGDNGKAAARLSTNAPVLYNKTLFSSSTAFKLKTLTTIKLNLKVALSSGICP